MRLIFFTGVLILHSACYSPPFERTEMVRLGDPDPALSTERFRQKLPDSFETENTIVFRFFRNEIAALGFASVDTENESFEIVCLNHMGIQLFHISGDKDGNHLRQAMPEFKEHPEFTDAVGNDIRRIYFDLVPDPSARAKVKRKRIVFKDSSGEKTIEHVFGGEDKVLLKKRAGSGWRHDWKVSFYEYFSIKHESSEYFFPGGIVLHNRKHRYRLIIRTRSVDL